MKSLTVFTPTYNREHTLLRLYTSLIHQTSNDFVWLIVDDGSIDNTEEIVKGWIKEGKIEIIYAKQINQGKSSAHNNGVKMTKTVLFTCVDSDDFLLENAVENILRFWGKNHNEKAVGILAFKQLHDGRIITTINRKCVKSTLRHAYSKCQLKGETMLIYRSDIIKLVSFPEYIDEKFVPEAYIYDLIDQKGFLLILREALYCCEYLNDGYSNNMAKLLVQNPKGYLAYIKQRQILDKSISEKIVDTIRYTAMCFASNQNKIISESIFPVITVLTLPLGYYLYIKKYKYIKGN